MSQLYQLLAEQTQAWRTAGYPCADYPAIAEILEYQLVEGDNALRFLRKPQIHSLEIYWYLRLVAGTPHIFDLYKSAFPKARELREALGMTQEAIRDFVEDNGMDALWERIRTDDDFVRSFKLEALRETLTLDYPSYIFALAMGAGKTMLIGAILATEFAMAMEYPGGLFVQNALVFAPGKTIIESLRELSEIPYDQVLPARMYKSFAASVKLTFTRDGDKDIPVIRGSSFNVVVTNTEKIRIQKETIRKSDIGSLFAHGKEDEARAEVANLRLQAIAGLPHLAIFSDEAHHTYGQSLDSELKKVRKTVDYLAAKTNLVCVVNTTGTPYYQRQLLKDVVAWYGLSEGIHDGYLKDVSGNIHAFSFAGNTGAYVAHVVKSFFEDYGEVALPNGAKAKLALYFPQTDDLRELKPVIDQALVNAGYSPALCLVNTSDDSLTKQADIDAFNRLNDPRAPHRVMLLVNKGTEGWNCPSLFACALVRKLRTSNNFVLQASTRCMRQIPGNTRKARIYLSTDNFNVLDRQLQETYGEGIDHLLHANQETRRAQIRLRKLEIPPLVVTREIRTVVRREATDTALALALPTAADSDALTRRIFTVGEQQASYSVLRQVGGVETISGTPEALDPLAASVELTARYRLPLRVVFAELQRLYGDDGDIPATHIDELARQLETQTRHYEVLTEIVDIALALVKPEGFRRETDEAGNTVYTAEIIYARDKEYLLLPLDKMASKNPHNFGFHYTPYNFDSKPEVSFYEQMLEHLNLHADEVADIYYTGALTDPAKTDFFVQYKDDKGKWRRYTPDFIIRKKDGRCLIVEIKDQRMLDNVIDGQNGKKALALRQWEQLNPGRLKYEMIFTAMETVPWDDTQLVRTFMEGK
jgi:hypothetical protein